MNHGSNDLKPFDTIPIFVLWIVLFSISLTTGKPDLAFLLAISGLALLLLFYFFHDAERFLFLTMLLIPLSVRQDIVPGSIIAFPGEFMMVLLAFHLLLNFRGIRIPVQKMFSHPLFLVLSAYLLWLTVTSFTSDYPLVSFKRTAIQVLYFLVFYIYLLTRLNRKENVLKFYLYYSLGMIVPVINDLVRHSEYHFNPQASYYMPQPFFIEHTQFGAALAFIIPTLFYLAFIPNPLIMKRTARWWIGVLFIFMLSAEFLAFSRAAWFSLILLPVLWLAVRLRISRALILTGFVAFVMFSYLVPEISSENRGRKQARSNTGNVMEQFESVSNIRTDISNLERMNRWNSALRMFRDRPVTGHGPGTYQFVYYRYQVRNEMTRISTYHGEKGNAHSEYLGSLAETGLPGFLVYLSVVLTSVFIAIRTVYRNPDPEIRNMSLVVLFSLMTFYIHTVFNGFIETDKIGPLVFGSLAIVTGLDIWYRKQQG